MLTLVEREKIDYRDLSVDFPLYAVRQLGISTDEVIDMAVLRSSLGTTQAFEASRLAWPVGDTGSLRAHSDLVEVWPGIYGGLDSRR